VLKCFCTRKKVRPLYIWMRLTISSVVFPHFPMMLVTMLFVILSLTIYLWCRTEEQLVLKWHLPISYKGVPNGSQIASLERIPLAIKERDQIAICKLPLRTPKTVCMAHSPSNVNLTSSDARIRPHCCDCLDWTALYTSQHALYTKGSPYVYIKPGLALIVWY